MATPVSAHLTTSASGRLREAVSVAWPCALALVLLAGMIARGGLIVRHPESADDAWGCFVVSLHHDAPVLAGVCGILWLAAVAPGRWWNPLLRTVAGGVVLLFLIDVCMIEFMGTRLSWGRLTIFAPQPDIVLRFLKERHGWAWAIALPGGFFGGLGAMCWWPARASRSSRPALAVGLVGAVVLGGWPVNDDLALRWMRENVVRVNLPSPERKLYSREKADELLAHYDRLSTPRRVTAPPDRRNVILLVVESWSSYQSQAFGGVRDWTPGLDAVARAHTSFTRFHAGGYCTAEGLVYLIGGVRFWQRMETLPVNWSMRDTLPRIFSRAGYQTGFLTSGPLGFSHKDVWLKAAGYDYLEGGDHPAYRDWPKLIFGAAVDEALYRRTLDWIREAPAGAGPWFLTVETVTSHIPYPDPATGAPNVEASFRYADKWAAWFVQELKARNFFENGVLIITGDHRAMVPVEPGEKERFGLGFSSRVPFVLVDPRRPAGERIDALFKQGDLAPSFRHWLGESVELGAFQASLFESEPNAENVALHRRGTERGIADVIFRDGEGQVKIAGDETAFISHRNITAERRAAVLALIAHERITMEEPRPVAAKRAR